MRHVKIVMGWHGLPAYAARLIASADSDFPVIASKPSVPIEGMDEILPGRIRWIHDSYLDGWKGLAMPVPDIYFQPSWSTPAFNRLGDEVRANGGKVVVMFDNRWRGDLRQVLGALRFRTQWRGKFDVAWVAGKSGAQLARFWGFSADRIFTGMYGADPTIFGTSQQIPLSERPLRMMFVGRLTEAKGVNELLAAWTGFHAKNSAWELHVYGSGELKEAVDAAPVHFHGFQQPEVIAAGMRQARFLILPSHEEHWGLVVCEAAQAGCGLLLSKAVGSHPDLLGAGNGMLFSPRSVSELETALNRAASLQVAQLNRVEEESRRLGDQFTPVRWAATFGEIREKISKSAV